MWVIACFVCFMFGGLLGFLVTALMNASSRNEDDEE